MSAPREITSGRQLEEAEITAAALLVRRWAQDADDEHALLATLGLPEADEDGEDGPSDYVPPQERPQQWAAMAAELRGEGRGEAEIADALCVSHDTVPRLLALADGEVAVAA